MNTVKSRELPCRQGGGAAMAGLGDSNGWAVVDFCTAENYSCFVSTDATVNPTVVASQDRDSDYLSS